MLDKVIRLSDFSTKEETLSGKLSLEVMARLSKRLATPLGGELSYHLAGECDAKGRLFLQATLSATLPVVCQRCFEVFEFPLNRAQRFYLQAANDDETCPEGCEPLDLTDNLHIIEFLEDELILSVPLSPTHALTVCKAANHIAS